MCAEGQGDSIHRIDEPSSCAYVLNIHTSRTCHHPYLRPPPSLKPRPILCYPALEQDQYDKYLEIKQGMVFFYVLGGLGVLGYLNEIFSAEELWYNLPQHLCQLEFQVLQINTQNSSFQHSLSRCHIKVFEQE